MRFCFAVDLSTESEIIGGLRMSASWGADRAAQLRKRLADKKADQKVVLENRRLLEEQGPALWMMLTEIVKDMVKDVNANYGSVIIRVKDVIANQLEVRLEFDNRVTDLKVTFSPTTGPNALQWEFCGDVGRHVKGDSCPLHIQPDGRVVFQQAKMIREPESLAKEMLDNLIAE